METILIVEDEEDIRNILKIYLQKEGYKVIETGTFSEGLEKGKEDVDLILLDLMLPGGDGVILCKELRKTTKIPIIMITAKNADMDKIKGLQSGADDYVTKPFNPLELLARIEAQLRRYREYSKNGNSDIMYYKALELDKKGKRVKMAGDAIKLTPTEFQLLEILLNRRGEVVSQEELFHELWEEEYYGKDSNTIPVHIRNLREKLGDSSEKPEYIVTVWGVGYIIEKE